MSFHDARTPDIGFLVLLPWWLAIPLILGGALWWLISQPTAEQLAAWDSEAQKEAPLWAENAYSAPSTLIQCRREENPHTRHCNVRVNTTPPQVVAVDWDAAEHVGELCSK